MKRILVLFYLISLLASNLAAQSAWIQKADCGGGERWHAISFSIGNKGYVGLGLDSTIWSKNFWEYNPSTNSWTQKANFPGTTRTDGIGFSIGDKGYVGLGGDTAGHATNEFWEYDTLTDAWAQKANLPMTGGNGFFCFSIEDKGYVGRGNVIWEYNPVADTWTQKANMPPAANSRSLAVGFSIGQKGYICLGINPNLFPYPAYFGDLWEYNPITDSWTQKAYFPGIARIAAVGFSINGKGYIGTGQDKDNNWYNDFYEYNPLTNVWIQKENVGGPIRYYAFGFGMANKGYIGSGSEWDISGIYNSRDFWEYDPTLDTLTNMNYNTSLINRFSIYPNPCNGKCDITVPHEFLNQNNLTLSVYTIVGKLIQQKQLSASGNQITLNIEEQAKGMYNVILSNGAKNYYGKIILE